MNRHSLWALRGLLLNGIVHATQIWIWRLAVAVPFHDLVMVPGTQQWYITNGRIIPNRTQLLYDELKLENKSLDGLLVNNLGIVVHVD